MKKKIISIVIAVAIIASALTAVMVSASANSDEELGNNTKLYNDDDNFDFSNDGFVIKGSDAGSTTVRIPPIGIYADTLDKAYDDSGLFVEFYNNDNELIGSGELNRFSNSENTGWYYQSLCTNIDITNGYYSRIKDGNGNELTYINNGASSSTGSSTAGSSHTLTIGVSPAISNITFTLKLSEEYTDCYCKELLYDIVNYDISDFHEQVAISSYTYDGSPKTPELAFAGYEIDLKELTYYTLEKDKDYTVNYENNINAGTATVTVTGIGKYKGTVTRNFTINKAYQELLANIENTTLSYGQKSHIVAIGEGEITYSSSNENVATVNDEGIVTAISEGYTVITITASGNDNYNPDSTRIIVFVNKSGENIKIGDVDGNGSINVDDVTYLQKYLAGIVNEIG